MIKPLAMNPFLHRAFALPLAHWRGEVALWPTLLLTLLGLRLLLFTLGGLPSLTLDAIVFIWQVTGTLRALNNAQADRPDLFNIVAGYGTIALCLPLMIFPQLDRTTADYLDLLPPQEAANTGLRLVPTYAILEGPIDFAMFTALEAALEDNPGLKLLELNSGGGRIFAARAIARLVTEHRLNTRVHETCASACTLVFIAGEHRLMSPEARLGFHGYRVDGYLKSVIPEEEEAKDRAAFLAQGINESFVASVFETSPEDMWFPTRSQLLSAGIVSPP